MNILIKEYFTAYEERFPEDRASIRKIALSLCREGIPNMEVLCQMQKEAPEKIRKIRNIGEKYAGLIAVICRQYENN